MRGLFRDLWGVFSSVRLCWELEEPKGPKGREWVGVALSTALPLNDCEGPLPGALPKRGLIKTGIGRVQATKKSNFEVDVGAMWSEPCGLGHNAHSYFVATSSWF